MSYTVADDDDLIHIRAVIGTRSDLQSLITILQRRLETDFAQEENHDNPTAEPVRPGSAPGSAPGISYGCTGAHTRLKTEAPE